MSCLIYGLIQVFEIKESLVEHFDVSFMAKCPFEAVVSGHYMLMEVICGVFTCLTLLSS